MAVRQLSFNSEERSRPRVGDKLMLIIREAQMAALERSGRERFGKEVVSNLRESSPHSIQGLGTSEIDERLAGALKKAERYQLRTDRDLRAFIRLSFVVGPNFDDYPPLRALLDTPPTEIPSDNRMISLFQSATEQDWNRAAVFDVVCRSHKRVTYANPGARSVSIRPLRVEDAQPYFYQLLHPDVWRLGQMRPIRSLGDTQRFFRTLQDRTDSKGFAIIADAADVVGAIFVELRGSPGQISYWVGRNFWGQGVASRAVILLLAFLREELGLTRAEAVIASDNLPSIRVVEKCGFVASRRDEGTAGTLHFSCDLTQTRGLENA